MSDMDIQAIYSKRFEGQLELRKALWKVLCRDYFQQYFPPNSTVAEMGAGYCEFINSIVAVKKIAVDINPESSKFADPAVQFLQSVAKNLPGISTESVDRVFTSNFFEHLSRPDIMDTLNEIHRILKPGGKVIILQPNFRYCYKDYYMFFDHISALDHRSMEEVLKMTHFNIQKMIPRFLPYTTRGNLPSSLFLLKIYLRFPLLWKIFGGQMLILAAR